MKRRLSAYLWIGFLIVLAALLSYLPLFARFPVTRDFPWVNLLLFAAGLAFIGAGLTRAYGRPDRFRGKVIGAALGAVAVLLFAVFSVGIFHQARQLPSSTGAPRVGQQAPDFTLPDQDGNPVTLSALLTPSGGAAGTRAAVLIFYRGHW
jgi:hypothetical protein